VYKFFLWVIENLSFAPKDVFSSSSSRFSVQLDCKNEMPSSEPTAVQIQFPAHTHLTQALHTSHAKLLTHHGDNNINKMSSS